MKKQINIFEAVDLLQNNGFSYDGAVALYEYLEELEYQDDQDYVLDPVGLRCEFSEYKNIIEVMDDYDHLDNYQQVLENTVVIEYETGILVQAF